MKRIPLGNMLTVLANFGVLIGILLLVYELQQARDFARTEYIANNRLTFLEVEREMMDPEVAAIWVKAAVEPDSLTLVDIRVMDAFLISLYNFWQQQWVLSQEGFLDPAQLDYELANDARFYLGSTFARVWWEDLKPTHAGQDVQEFDALIDEALSDADPSTNRDYLERIQRRLREPSAEEQN